MIKDFPFYGTVSSGTMRSEDLIPCFATTLHAIAGDDSACASLITEAFGLNLDYYTEQSDFVLADLFDALDALAPDGYYFGSHPGDGSDFGFWQVDCDE